MDASNSGASWLGKMGSRSFSLAQPELPGAPYLASMVCKVESLEMLLSTPMMDDEEEKSLQDDLKDALDREALPTNATEVDKHHMVATLKSKLDLELVATISWC